MAGLIKGRSYKGSTISYPTIGTGYKYEATNMQGQTRRFDHLSQAERWIDQAPRGGNTQPALGRAKGGMYR